MEELLLLDILLTIMHLLIIGFNLLGWIWPVTRKWHLFSILATAGSWFLLGIWYGPGYCPLTDWQWEVKAMLGEKDLPASFIKYLADSITGHPTSARLIDALTAVCFTMAAGMAVYMNFFRKKAPGASA